MYERHFGLVQKPFSILPDGSFLYRSRTHTHALTLLEYGLLNGVELMVITGDIGCGKTTLIRYLLDRIPADVDVGLISNPRPPFSDLLKWVLLSFDLDYRDKDKTDRHLAFMEFVLKQHKKNRRVLLIVDEAHNFQWQAIDQLMTLCNINAEKGLVIQVMLFGLRELEKTLHHPKLEQFAYRLGVRARIERLDEKVTKEYVTHRIKVAGGSESLFEPDCYPRIFHYTQGTPRLINTLCDTALAYAYAEQQQQVTPNIVEEVIQDKHGALLRFHDVPYQQHAPTPRDDAASAASTARRSSPQLVHAQKKNAAKKYDTEGEGRPPSTLSSTTNARPRANEKVGHKPSKLTGRREAQAAAVKAILDYDYEKQVLKSNSASPTVEHRASKEKPIRRYRGVSSGSAQKSAERPIHESANVVRPKKPDIQESRTARSFPNRKISSVGAVVFIVLLAGITLTLRDTPDSTVDTPPLTDTSGVIQQQNVRTPIARHPEHDSSTGTLVTDFSSDVPGEARDEDETQQDLLEPDRQAPAPVAADVGISTEVVVATASQTPSINVDQLLERAESQIKSQRLTSPKDRNAFDIYKTILSQYPDNEQARDGVRTIAETYRKWAAIANATGDLKKSERYYQRALEVNPTDSKLLVASLQLVRQRIAEDQNARRRLQQLGIDRTRQALITRAKGGNSTAVSLLLDAGLSPNTRDQYGFTLLMLAAIKGYLDIAEELLSTGADINARSDDGRTALMAAAWNGNDEVVNLLLGRNATVDSTSDEGWTALSYATMKGHDVIVNMLLAKGADPTIRDLNGATALTIAKKGGHSKIIRLISQSGN